MLKRLAKQVYIQGLNHYAKWQLKREQSQLLILMYHRVLPPTDPRYQHDEAGMIVSPQSLAMHLRELKTHNYRIVQLSDWLQRYKQGTQSKQTCVALTFDDGWLDNFEYAFPILQAQRAPFSLFAVSDYIGQPAPFWTTRLIALLHSPHAERVLRSPLLAPWLNTNFKPNKRQDCSALIARLKQLPDSALNALIAQLEHGENKTPPIDLINAEQLQAMIDSGLVELGSHSASHCRMHPALTPSQLEQEIVYSKHALEKQFSQQISLFCYPNGDITPQASRLVSQHYQGALSTETGINKASPRLNLHRLKRIALHEDMSNTPRLFHAQLSARL